MAKAKKSGANGEEKDEQTVLQYLKRTNRPYSTTDIFNNLHGAIGKTAVQKALNNLVEQQEISTKAYGKQSIYVVTQDQAEAASPEELEKLDQVIEGLKTEVTGLKDASRQLQSSLAGLKNSLTTKEIQERLAKLREANAGYEARLDTLRSGTRQVSIDDMRKINADYDYVCKMWRARRKLFKEMFDTITENMPQDPKQFRADIGIEEDDVDISVDPLATI
ncbi:hypothetical protein BZG36_00027 [Bifiguratus adelaidae]|uniref:Homologous-pairing protein 2 homolog n=1 Tax=Bifiguratus adelaidae TaxID=1938954 RepID=A0A261Y8G6_9FUNG|nr:hypothetical protein BZG36_00027 [Bifiguratus adelaidae]